MKDRKVLDSLHEAGIMYGLEMADNNKAHELLAEASEAITLANTALKRMTHNADLSAEMIEQLSGELNVADRKLAQLRSFRGDCLYLRNVVRKLILGDDKQTEEALVRLRAYVENDPVLNGSLNGGEAK